MVTLTCRTFACQNQLNEIFKNLTKSITPFLPIKKGQLPFDFQVFVDMTEGKIWRGYIMEPLSMKLVISQ